MVENQHPPLQYRQLVTTPIGPGRVDARIFGTDRVMVLHGRDWFPPETWAELCPLNGPAIFRQYDRADLIPHSKPFPEVNRQSVKPATWEQVVRSAKKTMEKQPQTLDMGAGKSKQVQADRDLVVLGSKWLTRRKGDRYEVVGMHEGKVKLSWLDGKYTRDVTVDSLLSNYDPIRTIDPDAPTLEDRLPEVE